MLLEDVVLELSAAHEESLLDQEEAFLRMQVRTKSLLDPYLLLLLLVLLFLHIFGCLGSCVDVLELGLNETSLQSPEEGVANDARV